MTQLNESNQSGLKQSRVSPRKRSPHKPSPFEINIDNYDKYDDFAIQKIDPKGLQADSIYISFSGTIQTAQIYDNYFESLQLTYKIQTGKQWHDQTPQINVTNWIFQDKKGQSTFCEVRNNQITFSLGFDCLLSCVYVTSWPQIVLVFKGFDWLGDLIPIGYAQIFLPMKSGQHVQQAYIYSIVKNRKWYHSWLKFLRPQIATYDEKDFEKIITKGEGRQLERVHMIGKIKVRTQVLLRNFSKFGYL